MVLTDPNRPDGPVVFVNRAFNQLTGYADDEVLGRNCRFLQGKATDPTGIRVLAEAIQSGREVQVELWNYRKDGTAFWNSMFVGPVYGPDGRLLYHFGSQLDATARKERDEATARAQRMDTLGAMAAGMAHEFNNLMTVVVGNVAGVSVDPLSGRQSERLSRIEWAARAAGRLTQQMLTFAGRQALRPDVVDLSETVRAFDDFLIQVAATLKVEIELCPEMLPVVLDVGQLEMALINLVRNAADASEPGARIMVATHSRETESRSEVEVSVTDEGSGMAAEVAAKATEPFFTTKEHGKGTGLGLSIVSGFCEQSGGRMVIESRAGRGTTVRLIFPRNAE